MLSDFKIVLIVIIWAEYENKIVVSWVVLIYYIIDYFRNC